MNYTLTGTETFQASTGISYATIISKIDKELRRQGFDIDTMDWGHSLNSIIKNLETSYTGFLVAAFINYAEVTMSELSLLIEVWVMGDGECRECGGILEHYETMAQGHEKVICNNCKTITDYYHSS